MEIELPQAKTGVEPQLDDNKSQKLTINIPAAGRLLLGMNPITQSSLKEYLQKQSRTSEDVEVRIRVNKDVPYIEVVPILKYCAENGIWNVAFPVIEE
jgi:biopolymer transport protein ExbD